MAESGRPEYPGIGHAGMVVRDLEDCVARFSQVLGIDSFLVYDFVPRKAWVRGREICDCKFRIAMAVLKNGSQLEIIEAISGDTPHREFIESGREGLHHISFYTDQYDIWLEYFKSLNTPILFEAEVEDEVKGYRRCFYAEDRQLRCLVEITEKSKFRTR